MLYKKIVSYCEKEGISISSFEKKCGIGNGTVGRWKDDVSKPALTTLEKIADMTGIPVSEWIKQESKGGE